MSLWPVNDSIARETMVAYYTGLRAGLGRGDALRQAKLAMLKRQVRQHPFYWASFIQSGEMGQPRRPPLIQSPTPGKTSALTAYRRVGVSRSSNDDLFAPPRAGASRRVFAPLEAASSLSIQKRSYQEAEGAIGANDSTSVVGVASCAVRSAAWPRRRI